MALSIGVRYLGISLLKDYLRAVLDSRVDDTIAVVSVGSGNGVVERKLNDDLEIKVICVDPEPNRYLSCADPMLPDYPSVPALVAARPEIQGNCILLLNWASPNESTYDIEAVRDLRPLDVVAVVETTTGIAGGCEFHSWLEASGFFEGVGSFRGRTSAVDPYHFVASTARAGRDDIGMTVVLVVIWLTKTDRDGAKKPDHLPKVVPGVFVLERGNCVIS